MPLGIQDRLEKIGHFPKEYVDISYLKLQFVTQLKLLLTADAAMAA